MSNVGNKRTIRKSIILLIFSAGIAFCMYLSFSTEIKSRANIIDKILLKGQVRNVYGKFIGETWEVEHGHNFKTLSSSGFLLIAHGNGFRNDSLENSRQGFLISKANGSEIFEIDIWTNDEGLYCAHELSESESVCDLSVLFEGIEKSDTIVADVKSDLEPTLQFLITNQNPKILKQMIVQLYQSEDAATFSKYSSHFQGAIFTLYRSNRRLIHICQSLSPTAFPVIVINQSKLNSAENDCPGHKFIVHPVKSCDVLMRLKAKNSVKGAFVSQEALNCKN